MAECDRLGRSDFREIYDYGPARDYILTYGGKEYDSKAIAGVALGFQYPEMGHLKHEDCHGGKAPGHAGWTLARLGFSVAGISPQVGWTLDEIEQTVPAYFRILAAELTGTPIAKKPVLEEVAGTTGRSLKAVEYKFQNISAVLSERGLRFASGYKPKSNYQQLLAFVVEDFLKASAPTPAIVTTPKVTASPSTYFEPAPKHDPPSPSTGQQQTPHSGGIVDWAKRDEANRKLGKAGEEFVLDLERVRLKNLGRSDLADRIEWVAKDVGDGFGYDIGSFEADGKPTCIEVKTTTAGKSVPFFLTAAELEASKRLGKRYRLFRVFNFGKEPRVYVLSGPLNGLCHLVPASFRAWPA